MRRTLNDQQGHHHAKETVLKTVDCTSKIKTKQNKYESLFDEAA